MEKKNSPFALIMQYAGSHKSKYICSVIMAVLSVICGMVPYFAIVKMVTAMIGHEEKELSFYVVWCIIAAAGYIAKGIFNSISVIKSFHLGETSDNAVKSAIEKSCDKNLAIEKQMTPYQIFQQIVQNLFAVIIMIVSAVLYKNGSMELAER